MVIGNEKVVAGRHRLICAVCGDGLVLTLWSGRLRFACRRCPWWSWVTVHAPRDGVGAQPESQSRLDDGTSGVGVEVVPPPVISHRAP